MHVGLCVLRLDPKHFWALTPREFAAMSGAFRPTAVQIGRDDLNALMALYPDQSGGLDG
ncbi:putative phage protein (TIGR02216 family) [Agrobacterium vitis]|nr:putative phage protein (TIGR02216 family) [Agrobacterium vitis]